VREPFRPVRFPGEWRIESELEDGGVGVLNLMTDRRLAQSELAFLRDGEERRIEAQTLILYAPSGAAAFHLGDERLVLAEDEAVRLDGQGAVPIRHEHGVLAIARIETA
jgi:environmental stress-induced protein Ves